MYTLNVSDKERMEMIRFFSIELKDLEKRALYCQNMLNKLRAAPKTDGKKGGLKSQMQDIVDDLELTDAGNNKTIPRQDWKNICLNSLNSINGFSSTVDIYDYLLEKDSVLIQYDKSDVISKISTALSNMYPKKTVQRVKNPLGRGYYWALPAWYSPELFSYYKKKLSDNLGVDEDGLFKKKAPK